MVFDRRALKFTALVMLAWAEHAGGREKKGPEQVELFLLFPTVPERLNGECDLTGVENVNTQLKCPKINYVFDKNSVPNLALITLDGAKTEAECKSAAKKIISLEPTARQSDGAKKRFTQVRWYYETEALRYQLRWEHWFLEGTTICALAVCNPNSERLYMMYVQDCLPVLQRR